MQQYYVYTNPETGNLRRVLVDSEHVARQGRITTYDSSGSHIVKSCNLAKLSEQNARKLFPSSRTVICLDVTGYNLAEITPDSHPELFL